MKVGSLVECTHECGERDFSEEVFPVIGKTYTVRSITGGRWKYLRLEEIINPVLKYDDGLCDECEFAIGAFKELQEPIANIEEYIKENTLTPELL